jgi:hypothetical protein
MVNLEGRIKDNEEERRMMEKGKGKEANEFKRPNE